MSAIIFQNFEKWKCSESCTGTGHGSSTSYAYSFRQIILPLFASVLTSVNWVSHQINARCIVNAALKITIFHLLFTNKI